MDNNSVAQYTLLETIEYNGKVWCTYFDPASTEVGETEPEIYGIALFGSDLNLWDDLSAATIGCMESEAWAQMKLSRIEKELREREIAALAFKQIRSICK